MGSLIAVYGATGGSGCTTVAVHLAAYLAQQGYRTLLIDLNFQYGDVGTILNLQSSSSILDCLIDTLDADLLASSVITHESGLKVLLAPPLDYSDAVDKQPKLVHQLLDVANQTYDFVIVDAGHYLTESLLEVFDRASALVVVLPPTLLGTKNARTLLSFFERRAYPSSKIIPILNQYNPTWVKQKLAIEPERIERHLKMPLEARLPLNEAAALRAQVRGTLLNYWHDPLGAALLTFSKFIYRLLVYSGDEHKTTKNLPPTASPKEKPSITARIGRLPSTKIEPSKSPPPPTASRPTPQAQETIEIFIAGLEEQSQNLKKLLAFESDFRVVDTTSSAEALLRRIGELHPSIVLLFSPFGESDGINITQQITEKYPTVAVIVLGANRDIDLLRRAMLAGARNFINLPPQLDELYSTIREVHARNKPIATQYSSITERNPLYSLPLSSVDNGGSSLPFRPQPDKDAARHLNEPTPKAEAPDDEGGGEEPPANEPTPEASPEYPLEEAEPPNEMEMEKPSDSKEEYPLEDARGGEAVPMDEVEEEAPDPKPQSPSPPGAGQNTPSLSSVKFSAYYPRSVSVEKRHGLYVYAHLDSMLSAIESDVEKFKAELGGSIPPVRTAKGFSFLQQGTPITVVPECDDLEFEPASLTKRWKGEWSRFDFDFNAPAALADEAVMVRVSVQVGGIEVAHIKCPLEVTRQAAIPQTEPENPLAAAKFKSQTSTPYQKIFISYSRQDSEVARGYKLAQTALGNDVFLDVDNLRTGEDWQAGLAKAIDSADIFQLFWSESSANSKYCRYEWDYALHFRCEDNQCEGFIRPVYWVNPMPKPPSELGHLNFRFVPFQKDSPG